jgi:hypothetical protein
MGRINIVWIVIALVAVGLFTLPAEAQLIEEDFDAYPAGAWPPAPWWYWGTSGTIWVDGTNPHGGSGHSLQFDRAFFDYQAFAVGQTLSPSLVGQAVLTYFFTLTGNTDREVFSVFGRNIDNNAVAWWVTHGGYFGNAVATYSETQGWTHVMDVVNDTWYGVRLEIDVTTHSFDITVWEETNPTNTSTVTGVDFRNLLLADPVDEIQIGDFSQTYSDTRLGYLDDLLFVGPGVFHDDFESGDISAWSN